jgi:hypothetical protein
MENVLYDEKDQMLSAIASKTDLDTDSKNEED